jgi:hypothetical protein
MGLLMPITFFVKTRKRLSTKRRTLRSIRSKVIFVDSPPERWLKRIETNINPPDYVPRPLKPRNFLGSRATIVAVGNFAHEVSKYIRERINPPNLLKCPKGFRGEDWGGSIERYNVLYKTSPFLIPRNLFRIFRVEKLNKLLRTLSYKVPLTKFGRGFIKKLERSTIYNYINVDFLAYARRNLSKFFCFNKKQTFLFRFYKRKIRRLFLIRSFDYRNVRFSLNMGENQLCVDALSPRRRTKAKGDFANKLLLVYMRMLNSQFSFAVNWISS